MHKKGEAYREKIIGMYNAEMESAYEYDCKKGEHEETDIGEPFVGRHDKPDDFYLYGYYEIHQKVRCIRCGKEWAEIVQHSPTC